MSRSAAGFFFNLDGELPFVEEPEEQEEKGVPSKPPVSEGADALPAQPTALTKQPATEGS
ncbi:hypothetical protein [Streptomyces phaeochromogenes]|uniref:hypothetical protein n=1 Tax=Streptomyces phaeochromogenes TaxID=1923 RepID=UPI0033DE63AB